MEISEKFEVTDYKTVTTKTDLVGKLKVVAWSTATVMLSILASIETYSSLKQARVIGSIYLKDRIRGYKNWGGALVGQSPLSYKKSLDFARNSCILKVFQAVVIGYFGYKAVKYCFNKAKYHWKNEPGLQLALSQIIERNVSRYIKL